MNANEGKLLRNQLHILLILLLLSKYILSNLGK
jgi:hypothetical protein